MHNPSYWITHICNSLCHYSGKKNISRLHNYRGNRLHMDWKFQALSVHCRVLSTIDWINYYQLRLHYSSLFSLVPSFSYKKSAHSDIPLSNPVSTTDDQSQFALPIVKSNSETVPFYSETLWSMSQKPHYWIYSKNVMFSPFKHSLFWINSVQLHD